jgi:probable addiction module antidote protein
MDLAGELDGRGGRSLKTLPYDPAEFLDDEIAMADYLPSHLRGRKSGGDCAGARRHRARGMTEIAAKTGITRPALYKALSGEEIQNSQPSPKWPKPSASALRSNP